MPRWDRFEEGGVALFLRAVNEAHDRASRDRAMNMEHDRQLFQMDMAMEQNKLKGMEMELQAKKTEADIAGQKFGIERTKKQDEMAAEKHETDMKLGELQIAGQESDNIIKAERAKNAPQIAEMEMDAALTNAQLSHQNLNAQFDADLNNADQEQSLAAQDFMLHVGAHVEGNAQDGTLRIKGFVPSVQHLFKQYGPRDGDAADSARSKAIFDGATQNLIDRGIKDATPEQIKEAYELAIIEDIVRSRFQFRGVKNGEDRLSAYNTRMEAARRDRETPGQVTPAEQKAAFEAAMGIGGDTGEHLSLAPGGGFSMAPKNKTAPALATISNAAAAMAMGEGGRSTTDYIAAHFDKAGIRRNKHANQLAMDNLNKLRPGYEPEQRPTTANPGVVQGLAGIKAPATVAETDSTFYDNLDGKWVEFAEPITAASAQVDNVSPELLFAVMNMESEGNGRTNTRSGARGIFQIMPATAARHGFEPEEMDDPNKAAFVAAKELEWLIRHFDGDLRKAVAGYNGFYGKIDNAGSLEELWKNPDKYGGWDVDQSRKAVRRTMGVLNAVNATGGLTFQGVTQMPSTARAKKAQEIVTGKKPKPRHIEDEIADMKRSGMSEEMALQLLGISR